MESVARWLASRIRNRPAMVVAGAMALALALSLGIPKLKFETGQDRLLDPNSALSRANARYQAQFGGDPMLILFEASGDGDITGLFTAPNRDTMRRLQDDLDSSGNYQSVLTPLIVVEFARTQIEQRMISEPAKLAENEQRAGDEAGAAAAARGAPPAEQEAAAAAAKQKVDDQFAAEFGPDATRFVDAGEHSLDNPKFVKFVILGADGNVRPELTGIFPDSAHALMVARLKGNLSLDDSAEAAAATKKGIPAYRFEGVNSLVSGPPLLIKEINDKMKSALVIMAVFAVLIMVLVLFLVFRARWQLLSLPAVLVGCVSAFGLMGFTGIPLTMVTISGLPILIGLGVDFAIQAHSRLEEETLATGSAEQGLERTFVRLGPALGMAAVAGCIGFIVLQLSDVPMIRDFGSMLAVGAVIVFAVSITLVSGVIYLRERRRIGQAAEQPRARFEVERIVRGLTSRTVGRLAPIAAVATVVALVGLYVSSKIPTQTDPERFVPSNSSVLKDLHRFRDVAGSTSEVDLLIETRDGKHVTDQDVLDWMLSYEESERQVHRELMQSNSVASFAKSVTGDNPTTASAEQALSLAPPALANAVVNEDRTMAAIVFSISDDATLKQQQAITDALQRDATPPTGVSVAPAGIAVVGAAAVDAIASNRELMSFVAIGAILALLFVAYRNPVKAIAPILPVVLALGASAMLLYFGGIEYSPLTSISGPLIIAMGTEFNILLMSRYFEERAAGLDARAAMSKASMRIGRAIMASGLTVMGGFAVLAVSNFPLLDNFGRVTALNIGLSLLSTLVLLPPLLVWADEEHNFIGVRAAAAPLAD